MRACSSRETDPFLPALPGSPPGLSRRISSLPRVALRGHNGCRGRGLFESAPHSSRVSRCAVDAFIALGGNADKTGNVVADKLRGIVKEFGLTIDIDRLIREVDTDHSGLIDYQEFAVMMKN